RGEGGARLHILTLPSFTLPDHALVARHRGRTWLGRCPPSGAGGTVRGLRVSAVLLPAQMGVEFGAGPRRVTGVFPPPDRKVGPRRCRPGPGAVSNLPAQVPEEPSGESEAIRQGGGSWREGDSRSARIGLGRIRGEVCRGAGHPSHAGINLRAKLGEGSGAK